MLAAVVSDVHAPLHRHEAVAWALEFLSEVRPRIMILAGDTGDFAGTGDHPHERPEDYIDDVEAVADICRRFREATPGARHVKMDGNHDDRNEREGSRAGRYFRRALRLTRHSGEFQYWHSMPYEKSRRGIFKHGRLMVYHGHKTGKTAHLSESVQVCRIAGGCFNTGVVVLGHTHKIIDPVACQAHGLPIGLRVCNGGTFIDVEQATYAKNYDTSDWAAGITIVDTDARGRGPRVYREGESWDG